jgi:PKD repeat protein
LWDNKAGGSPNEVYLESGATIDVSYTDIKGGWTGTGNIDSDPLFVDPGYSDCHLQAGSPCIDAGNNDAPDLPVADFEGDLRKVDDPNTTDTGNGTAPIVDMGVDEYAPDVLRANFNADPTVAAPSLTVAFTDHSTGSPTAWSWDFDNDGQEDSSLQNPSHIYTSDGIYTVSLTVTNGVQDTVTKTDYIIVVPAPVADFTADVTSGDAPLTVNFTDQSTGSIDTWEWDFDNNGTIDSYNQSPAPWIYDETGDYTVSLTVTGLGGSDMETKTEYIHVSESGPEKIVVIREKPNGKQRLFIFNTPPGPDSDTGDPIAYDFSFGQSGTNADNIAMAGVDVDGNGIDEIAVIREKVNGKQRLFIFNAPPGPDSDTGDPVAYDFSFGQDGTNANNIAMAGVDVDGNGIDEIAVIRQKPNGKQRLFIFNAPSGPDTDTGDPIAYDFSFGRDNSDLNNIAIAGVDVDGNSIDEIAVIREKVNGKQRLFIFNAPPGPDSDTGDPVAYDFSFGQDGTNANNIAMAGIRY